MPGPGGKGTCQVKKAADRTTMESITTACQLCTKGQANHGFVGNDFDDFDSQQFLEGNVRINLDQ